MPFQSSAQEKFMFAKHPDIANKWVKEYGQPKDLPKHVSPEKHPKGSIPTGLTGSIKSPWLSMKKES